MKGKKQYLSILMVLAFVVALPASGVWGQDGAQQPAGSAGPEAPAAPEYIWYQDVEIQKDTPTYFFRDTASGANDWWLRAYHGSSPDWFELYDWSNSRRIFTVEAGGQTDSIFIEADGDVGLRTSNPAYNLDVQGTTPGFRVGTRFYYHDDGSPQLYMNGTSGTAVYVNSASGDAIRGYASSATGNWWGVLGSSSSPDGEGVLAQNSATTGMGHGLYATSNSSSGRAVHGYATRSTGANYGVFAESASTSGTGVLGRANAGSGITYGLYGVSNSTSGRGVLGTATASSGTNYGVAGVSASANGIGAWGHANSTHSLATTYGVYGRNDADHGAGVVGLAASFTGASTGVLGSTRASNGWAGRFVTTAGNGVYVSAPAGNVGLNVASGTKNAVVRTEDGSRLLYAEESTQVWFSDYGFGQLQKGVAVVPIDPVFAQTVSLQKPYHVFLEEYGPEELYVSQRTPEWFEVRAQKGKPNVEFSYRLVAKRMGYEEQRLERAPWADADPNLYPENQAAWEAMVMPEPIELEVLPAPMAPEEQKPEPVEPVEEEAPVEGP